MRSCGDKRNNSIANVLLISTTKRQKTLKRAPKTSLNPRNSSLWCRPPGSNWGPQELQSCALPTELSRPHPAVYNSTSGGFHTWMEVVLHLSRLLRCLYSSHFITNTLGCHIFAVRHVRVHAWRQKAQSPFFQILHPSSMCIHRPWKICMCR